MFPNMFIEPTLGIQTGVGAGYPDSVRPLEPQDYEQFPQEVKQILGKRKTEKHLKNEKEAKDDKKKKTGGKQTQKSKKNADKENKNKPKKQNVKRFKKLKESIL